MFLTEKKCSIFMYFDNCNCQGYDEQVEDIDTFIDRITNYSGKLKINAEDDGYQITYSSANRTVNHLEEIKGELRAPLLNIFGNDFQRYSWKQNEISLHTCPQNKYEQDAVSTKYVPFMKSMLAFVDLVLHDRNHKKDVKKQMKSSKGHGIWCKMKNQRDTRKIECIRRKEAKNKGNP